VPAAARHVLAVLCLGVLPVLVAVAMFAVASDDGSLSVDFHNELYPEAKLLLGWENPFPRPGTTNLGEGRNFIWPPLAALLVAPFTLLPAAAADWAVAIAGLACFLASLRIVGVRDWRVYGAFALWPSVIGEIRVSHLTPVLCVLVALAWRLRARRFAGGVAVGLAAGIKFFLWPLVVWLAATGRRSGAATAVAIAGASVLLVLPFTSLDDYLRVLLDLGRTFDQESYNPYGLVVQLGLPSWAGRAVTLLVGATLLVGCWRWRSLALAIAAALVLSPIVWLDYYAVAAIPLAAVLPRLAPIWFVPLVTWGLLSAGIGAGNAWGSVRVLLAFGLVLGVAAREERSLARLGSPRPVGGRSVAEPSLRHGIGSA
jgi:alpha-1,2-mannosyltransferase